MSFKKGAPSFPPPVITKNCSAYREKITSEIAAALHLEYGGKLPPNKKIANGTATMARAIKNWFSGRNAPDSANLIHLMEHSDAVLAAVLRLANRHDVVTHVLMSKREAFFMGEHETGSQKEPINGLQTGPIKLKSADSCLRQTWFVDQIREGKSPSVSSITLYWKVGMKKAKKDIGVLKTRGVIAFVGAKKNGRYVLL
jgi:hypothetical protein